MLQVKKFHTFSEHEEFLFTAEIHTPSVGKEVHNINSCNDCGDIYFNRILVKSMVT